MSTNWAYHFSMLNYIFDPCFSSFSEGFARNCTAEINTINDKLMWTLIDDKEYGYYNISTDSGLVELVPLIRHNKKYLMFPHRPKVRFKCINTDMKIIELRDKEDKLLLYNGSCPTMFALGIPSAMWARRFGRLV